VLSFSDSGGFVQSLTGFFNGLLLEYVIFFKSGFLFSEHIEEIEGFVDISFTSGDVGGQMLDEGFVFSGSFSISFFSSFSFELKIKNKFT
jgi:hypothetical protein